MDDTALVLDGNAAAGVLHQIFGAEMSASRCACAGCGLVESLGGERAYMHAPGIVLRCRGCDNVLMVVVEAPGRYWLGFEGLRSLEITVS
jgi:hypothetical protein